VKVDKLFLPFRVYVQCVMVCSGELCEIPVEVANLYRIIT
jgi:hypothetical protein